jgi:hypothetical protein
MAENAEASLWALYGFFKKLEVQIPAQVQFVLMNIKGIPDSCLVQLKTSDISESETRANESVYKL